MNQTRERVRAAARGESPTDSPFASSTRRELLKLVGLAGLSGLTGFGTGRAQAETAPPESLRVQRTPLAVAMWDYSWLTRRSGREAEFADFDAVLDDFVARGYNALRIDVFPHLIARDAAGHRQPTFDMRPQWGGFPWGNSDYVSVNPRRDLPEFMQKCAARGLRIGLSTWLTNDTSDRATAIATPADLADCWSETLEFLGEHGLLGMVEWVDLGNEFPSVAFMPSVVAHINSSLDSNNQIGRLHGYMRPYTPAQGAAISTYMEQAIATLKKRFPGLPCCFSLLGDGTTATFAHHDFSSFDLLEPHIWLGQNTRFGLRSGIDVFLIEGFGPVQTPRINLRVENHANRTYFRQRDQLLKWLGNALDSWVELGNRLGVPVYTTEAWASTNYYDLPALDPTGSAWDWVFDAAVNAAAMAKERGWSGICSANFCEPMFPAFYDDISWHREVTSMILA